METSSVYATLNVINMHMYNISREKKTREMGIFLNHFILFLKKNNNSISIYTSSYDCVSRLADLLRDWRLVFFV
jgi:hypothetical protein